MQWTRIWAVMLAVGLACGGMLEVSLEGEERFYLERLDTLERMQLLDPAKQAELDAEIASFKTTYANAPSDPELRRQALSELSTPMRAATWEWDDLAAEGAAAQAKVLEAKVETYKQDFYGTWIGGDWTLIISPNGNVDWKQEGSGTSKSINAPITRFGQHEFEVGMLGITSTFHIDTPPHDDNGTWKMTLDGVDLVRQ
jgi:hypothetical protein